MYIHICIYLRIIIEHQFPTSVSASHFLYSRFYASSNQEFSFGNLQGIFVPFLKTPADESHDTLGKMLSCEMLS